MPSKSFGSRLPTTDRVGRPVDNRLDDLRADVEAGAVVLEARTDFPRIDKVVSDQANAEGVDVVTVTDATDTVLTLTGEGFDGDGRASLTVDQDEDDNQSTLVFRAIHPGEDGNNIDIVFVVGAGALSCAVATVAGRRVVTITLSAAGSDGGEIQAEVNGDAEVGAIIHCAEDVDGGTGATDFIAQAATPLTGGVGEDGVSATVGGLDATPTAANYGTTSVPSDTNLVLGDISGTDLAAGDAGAMLAVHVTVAGMAALPVSVIADAHA